MAKNENSSLPGKMNSSEKVNNPAKASNTHEKESTEKGTGTEPASESNLSDTGVLNQKNLSRGKTSGIKDVEAQNPVEEAANEKDIVAKEILPENNEGQPLESGDKTPSLTVPEDESGGTPTDSNCKCMQKKPGGKYFCFKLVQGRWMQSSAIPFDSKEFCEEICC